MKRIDVEHTYPWPELLPGAWVIMTAAEYAAYREREGLLPIALDSVFYEVSQPLAPHAEYTRGVRRPLGGG